MPPQKTATFLRSFFLGAPKTGQLNLHLKGLIYIVSKKNLFRKFITDVWLIWFESALKEIMLSPELKIQMCLQTSPKNNKNHTTSKSRIQIRQLNETNNRVLVLILLMVHKSQTTSWGRLVVYPHYLQGSIYPNGGWGHGISEPSINRSDGSKIQL